MALAHSLVLSSAGKLVQCAHPVIAVLSLSAALDVVQLLATAPVARLVRFVALCATTKCLYSISASI